MDDHSIFLISAHSDTGVSHRTFGFYLTEMEARDRVERDSGGMREALYDYLVIERVWPGIYGSSEVVDWFRWIEPTLGHGGDVRWQWCRPPEWAKGLTGLGGIG